MKYIFRETKKSNYGIAYIDADSVDEAIDKFGGVDEVIQPYGVFKNMYFTGVYEVLKDGEVNPCKIVHSSRVLNGYGYHGGGRKKMNPEDRKVFKTASISATPDQMERLKQMAKDKGVTLSRLVVETLLNE